jgi:beta-lactamase class A
MFRARSSRALTLLVVLTGSVRVSASGPDLSALEEKFSRLVDRARGQVGVSLIHVESGATLAVRGDQRFPMASVYKLPIAIELLSQIAQGVLTWERAVTLAPSDIRACCTLSRRHPRGGVTMTAADLLELMIVESDNTASDAVLKLVGGPAVVERRMRALGFTAINVNRYEGDINFEMTGVVNPPPQAEWTLDLQYRLISEVTPQALREARERYTSDPRDTSTPDEMARLLGRLQLGNLLPPQYTQLLLDHLARVKTGTQRLKALLPPDTVVAHKTGTTDVVINDVGIITLPDDSAIPGHLALAVFVTNGGRLSAMQRTIAQLSGAAFEFFTGKPLPPLRKAKAPLKSQKRAALRESRNSQRPRRRRRKRQRHA